MKNIAIVLSLTATLGGSAWAQGNDTAPQAPSAGQTVASDPISDPIRPFDVLKITVVGAPYLSDQLPVDRDGTVYLAALHTRFQVASLTRIQAGELIRRTILERKFLKRPEVGVSYVSRKAREVALGGAVALTNRQLLRDGDLLSDVLGRASPLANADLSRVSVTRGAQRLAIDYKRFTNGREDGPSVNPRIEDGDRIFVPAAELAGGNVRVRGEVKDPTKTVVPILEGTTVGLILQSVGGVTELADKTGIYVQRGAEKIAVPYDDIVKGVAGKDVKLSDKDELVVPKLERARTVSVSGAGVLKPGSVPFTPGLTLADALAQAGGFQLGAKRKEIHLERRTEGGKSVVETFNLEKGGGVAIVLKEGDLISVDAAPVSQKNGLSDAFNILSGIGILFSIVRR